MSDLIRNRDLVSQSIDYSGVENGLIHPSDIDLTLTFDDKFLIIGEVKYRDTPIPLGQLILLRNLVDGWNDRVELIKERNRRKELELFYNKHNRIPYNPQDYFQEPIPERKAIAFKLTHTTPPDQQFILLRECIVEQYYYNGKWHMMDGKKTFLEVLKLIGEKWGIKKITKNPEK
jgi:hypothetical protein